MIALRVAAVLVAPVAAAGCWATMPAIDPGSGAALVPVVIAPESEAAVEEADLVEPHAAGVAERDPGDDDPPEAAPSARLEVEAVLVEARSASHCGVAKWVVVMRYEVRRVIAGTYPVRELYVAHQCPEMGLTRCRGASGERVAHFRAGEVHRLQLTRGAGDGAVKDSFGARELPRYGSRCGEMVAAHGN